MRRNAIGQLAALVTALALTLTGCGGSGGGANSNAVEVDAAGILKYGYPMPVAGLHFDPTQSVLTPDVIWMAPVFGTLLRQSAAGAIEPWMADGFEILDPQTVKITLRPDLRFTDGSAYDAEAVRTSLMRARTPATPAAKGGMDPAMKVLADVEMLDPLTVVARLSAPLAGQFVTEMSQRNGAIVSPKQIAENPGQIDTNPIGAGPFTLVTNTQHQLLSFRKNPDYWDAENVQLGGLDIINTPTGPQQANGLLAGNLDWASYIPVDSAKRVETDDRFTTDVSEISNVEIVMCTGEAPFDSKAVRQAIQLGIDRQRFADLAFGGIVGPAYSLFPVRNENFAPQVKDLITYDPEQAKELLATAGASNLTFDLHYPATLDFGPEAEVLQAQLASIGVNVNIVAERDTVSSFIAPQKPGALLNASIGSTGYSLFNRTFGPGGLLTLCGIERPDVMAAVNEAAGLSPEDPKAIKAYQRAQEIVAENAYYVPIVGYPRIAGWNTARVGGTPLFTAQGNPQFDSIYITR